MKEKNTIQIDRRVKFLSIQCQARKLNGREKTFEDEIRVTDNTVA